MKDLLKKIWTRPSNTSEPSEPKDFPNEGIIDIYNKMKGEWKLIPADGAIHVVLQSTFWLWRAVVICYTAPNDHSRY
jgi:hypothetical protein